VEVCLPGARSFGIIHQFEVTAGINNDMFRPQTAVDNSDDMKLAYRQRDLGNDVPNSLDW
jgi:hypothetical protein